MNPYEPLQPVDAMIKVKVVAVNPDNPDFPVVIQIHDSHFANVSMNELLQCPSQALKLGDE